MRIVFVLVAMTAVGCATVEVMSTPDASTPPAGLDAGAEAEPSEPADGGPTCPGAPQAATCTPYGTACDGGYRYGCFGGICPGVDVGSCRLLSNDPSTRYAETCCEKQACTRVAAPGDQQCFDHYDAGGWVMWQCPTFDGKELAAPPTGKKCTNLLGTPTDPGPGGVAYCCRQ